jgi:hypothetical protein
VNDDRATTRTEGRSIEVERCLVVVLPGRHGRGDGGLTEEIESELSLWKEFVPQVVGEDFAESRQNGKEVGFEGLDGSFG